MKRNEVFTQIASLGTAFIGTIVSVIAVAEGDPEIMFAIGLPMLTLGGVGFRHFRKKAKKRIQRDREQELMRLFIQTGSRFSIAEVALSINLTIDDTRNLMEQLIEKGVFDIETTESGAIVYSIPIHNSYTIEPRSSFENGGW